MEQQQTLGQCTKKLFIKETIDAPPVIDGQTGEQFMLVSEAIWDIAAAIFSVVYLLAMLLLFSWALFDVYHGQNRLLARFFSEDTFYPDSPLCRLIAYTVIGGGLGGIVNGFRSIVNWHSTKKAFGWRFVWKYITLPWLGAVLAAMVYAVINGGIGVLGGNIASGDGSENQALTAFGIGALTGYGSYKVCKWLDDIVNRMFSTVKTDVIVPVLTDKTKDEADEILKAYDLKLGKPEFVVDSDETKVGKIIGQNPTSGTKVSKASSVDVKIAKKEDEIS